MTAEENIKFREILIKDHFKRNLGYELNLENPKTFQEKMQWLKLYYHDPLMTKCADKCAVRDYVKEKIGDKYFVPILFIWDKIDDIDFNSLPNQFVLKTNYGSNQNIIIKDKSKSNIEEIKEKLHFFLRPFASHYYKGGYEWQYKNIPPKIICEQYIDSMSESNIITYGFNFICNKFVFIDTRINSHTENETINFYDEEWNILDLKYERYNNNVISLPKPNNLKLMLSLANILASEFYIVRVDFYEINNIVYFSELTLTPWNGSMNFEPKEYNIKFGELLTLPKEKKIEYDFIDRDTLLREYLNLEKISFEYKKLEEGIVIKNNELSSKDNIIDKLNDEIYRLKEKEEEYNNLINKIAWWIPIKKWRDDFRNKITRPDQTRPDQTRPDQTRPDHELICIDYICFYHNSNYKKIQPMLQPKMAA